MHMKPSEYNSLSISSLVILFFLFFANWSLQSHLKWAWEMKFAWPHTRVVSQARPFPFRSAKHFQYAILKVIGAVEWKGFGLRD